MHTLQHSHFLESEIDVGQEINIWPVKLQKNYKHRGLNKRRAFEI